MLYKLSQKISDAESTQAYLQAVKELTDYLYQVGLIDQAEILNEMASLRENRFSKRATDEELAVKKAAVADYCRTLQIRLANDKNDVIYSILMNFDVFCRNLYITKVHEKCSVGVKQHLTGFCIENEYDLQKLMFAVLSAYFSDARTESVQDSGHHSVRKDIVIDSESAVIELKCTRNGMTERQLSEEIAADMIHYDSRNLYFYIYDRFGIIDNATSFRLTYENKDVDNKTVRMIIYNHSDI